MDKNTRDVILVATMALGTVALGIAAAVFANVFLVFACIVLAFGLAQIVTKMMGEGDDDK